MGAPAGSDNRHTPHVRANKKRFREKIFQSSWLAFQVPSHDVAASQLRGKTLRDDEQKRLGTFS
jgi:hypothetical protein